MQCAARGRASGHLDKVHPLRESQARSTVAHLVLRAVRARRDRVGGFAAAREIGCFPDPNFVFVGRARAAMGSMQTMRLAALFPKRSRFTTA
jgi:hypothetical protein